MGRFLAQPIPELTPGPSGPPGVPLLRDSVSQWHPHPHQGGSEPPGKWHGEETAEVACAMQAADLWCKQAVFHQWESLPDELPLICHCQDLHGLQGCAGVWVAVPHRCPLHSRQQRLCEGGQEDQGGLSDAGAGCWQWDRDREAGDVLRSGAAHAGAHGLAPAQSAWTMSTPFGAVRATSAPAHEADGGSSSGGDGCEEDSFLRV